MYKEYQRKYYCGTPNEEEEEKDHERIGRKAYKKETEERERGGPGRSHVDEQRGM